MKVAMIGGRGIPSIYSGVEVFLKELCPRLVARGHEVTVYCRPECFTAEYYKGVKLVKVPSIRTKHLGTMTHSFMSTVFALKKRTEIFHFNAIGPAAFSFIPRLQSKPSVATIHSLNWKHSKWNKAEKTAIKAIEYLGVQSPNAVVAVSMQIQKYIDFNYNTNSTYIPNGVELGSHLSVDRIRKLGLSTDGYLLYVGRLSPEKGPNYLIDAFNKIDSSKKLVIAGDAPDDPGYLRSLKDRANDRVLFLGHVASDILPDLYRNASIFVLPSESEGLSISLLEAMSNGCCVVASDIPENLDVISDCGISFEFGNVPMLTNLLSSLIEDIAMRKKMGIKAKKRVEKLYRWDDICSRYEDIYRNIACTSYAKKC